MIDMLDKIINIDFIAQDGNVDSIICPEVGIKPDIHISGMFEMKDIISNVSLKITNCYLKRSISDYAYNPLTGSFGYIQITAGYKNSLMTGIYGTCFNSFQENPSPDGVTEFEIQVGKFTEWISKTINVNYDPQATLRTVLEDAAQELDLTLKMSSDINFILDLHLNFNGYVKDFVYKVKQIFPELVIRPDGENLYVYQKDTGTEVTHTLDKIYSAKKDAAGFIVSAPWLPNIRPGDNIEIDPVYFKSSFGANLLNVSSKMQCMEVEFDFDTNDETNNMTLRVIAKGT